jgi:hypothetical protein
MPQSLQQRSKFFKVLAPWLWPIVRGMFRWVAQRPLPSIMMATCLGKNWGFNSGGNWCRFWGAAIGLNDSLGDIWGDVWVMVWFGRRVN